MLLQEILQHCSTVPAIVIALGHSEPFNHSPGHLNMQSYGHTCAVKSHLRLLGGGGGGLCCRPQLLWNLFSMFVDTAMLWSNFPLNLCVLLQIEIVSTWVGNAQTNTPKLRMAPTSHLFLVSAWVFKPTKMGREVSCLFCVSEVMVASYYGRQSIAKLTTQPYFKIIDWLLIALSHTVQSVLNLIINVELIHSFFTLLLLLEHFRDQPEQLKHRLCTACSIQGLSSVSVKHKNRFFATICWDPAVKIFSRNREVCT